MYVIRLTPLPGVCDFVWFRLRIVIPAFTYPMSPLSPPPPFLGQEIGCEAFRYFGNSRFNLNLRFSDFFFGGGGG